MANKQLITEADVGELPRGGVLRIDGRMLVTPAALDAAHARGMRVVYEEASGSGRCSNSAKPKKAPCLWHSVLASEGTFVVQVKNGHATVSQITDAGPVLFGTDSEAEHHG